jgi:N-acetylglucosaminyldiphosphoundecaprenol N-acetyl-beta-D-mannosaminyltransferase
MSIDLISANRELTTSLNVRGAVRASAASEDARRRTTAGHPTVTPALPDDLAREVYCILGMPVDMLDMRTALSRIEAAADQGGPFLVSTPNLNFLISSLSNPEFQHSLTVSDLCAADGMPIIWIARLLGLPFRERIAGSAVFDALSRRDASSRSLRVFMFGGEPGVAEAAARSVNENAETVTCVGSVYPGHGTVDELSNSEVIDAINRSKADFLVVALGAAKGQSWLLRNHDRLTVPIRAHLGAVINFQAGTIRRAPAGMQKIGLEWLWRIKEEPHLWNRYWTDGKALLRLLTARILPLALSARLSKWRYSGERYKLGVRTSTSYNAVTVHLSGRASKDEVEAVIGHFRAALEARKNSIIVDLAGVKTIDARFLGLLLMLHKSAREQGAVLQIVGASKVIRRIFLLNTIGYMLSPDGGNRHVYEIQPSELPDQGVARG